MFTLNPTTVLDVRVSYVHTENNRWPDDLGRDMTTLGWPASYNNDMELRVLALPSVSGFDLGSGVSATDPEIVIIGHTHTYSFTSNVTRVMRAHTIKFGYELRINQFNFIQKEKV